MTTDDERDEGRRATKILLYYYFEVVLAENNVLNRPSPTSGNQMRHWDPIGQIE